MRAISKTALSGDMYGGPCKDLVGMKGDVAGAETEIKKNHVKTQV